MMSSSIKPPVLARAVKVVAKFGVSTEVLARPSVSDVAVAAVNVPADTSNATVTPACGAPVVSNTIASNKTSSPPTGACAAPTLMARLPTVCATATMFTVAAPFAPPAVLAVS